MSKGTKEQRTFGFDHNIISHTKGVKIQGSDVIEDNTYQCRGFWLVGQLAKIKHPCIKIFAA